MPVFKLFCTGDDLDETGIVKYGDIGLDSLKKSGCIETGFLLDQKPALRATARIGTGSIRLRSHPNT